MKRFDFTQTGGFPLTQDRLKWLQDGRIDGINALAALAGITTPCAVSGVELTAGSWATSGTVSDGWVFHPALGLMPFVGGSFTAVSNDVIYQDTFPAPPNPLSYESNAQYNVQIQRVASISAGATQALRQLSQTRWGMNFGKENRTGWLPATLLSGFTGSVQYLYDQLADVVYVKGSVTMQPSGLSFNPFPWRDAFSISADFVPSSEVYFSTQLENYVSDALDLNPHTGSNGRMRTQVYTVSPGPNQFVSTIRGQLMDVATGVSTSAVQPYTQHFNFSFKR